MARAPLKSAGPKTVRAVKANEEWGSDSRRFLDLGKTDEHGEDTVMTIDTDDTRFLRVNGPVDVWLEQPAGFLAEESVYGKVRRPASQRANRTRC